MVQMIRMTATPAGLASADDSPSVSLAGVKLMVGTPCGDGRIDVRYLISWFETAKMLAQAGCDFFWNTENYNADIVSARAKILRAFLKSSCTHLLFIDSDMGWATNAVARLFFAKKDFAAVAGRKKVDPLKKAEYAVNAVDEAGKRIVLSFDQATGTTEVSEVGLACALITRGCAEQMVDAYRDLSYTND